VASKAELYRELHQLHDVATLKRDFEKRLAEQQVRFDAELSKTHTDAGYVNALDVLHALADQKLVPHRVPPELLTAALNDPDITPLKDNEPGDCSPGSSLPRAPLHLGRAPGPVRSAL